MTDYELLINESEECGLITKEKELYGHDGLIFGNRIAIRKGLTENKKACILAEELGHYHTSSGNIIDYANTSNFKQERTARMWSYNRMIGLVGIIKAYEAGCRNKYEIADYLNVTEEFLCEALEAYRNKYGTYATVDNYAIYFIPTLGVMKLL